LPFTISLAIYLLYKILNVAVFVGFFAIIALFPLLKYLANKIKDLQAFQMKLKDERVKLTNEILNGIKALKLYAWEPSFEEQIAAIRSKEIKMLRKAAMLTAFTEFMMGMSPFLFTFASFVTWTLLGNELTPSTVFVSLALFNALKTPLLFCE
jgi:ABC-type multidrug transport system fused ATPase/permease subunit